MQHPSNLLLVQNSLPVTVEQAMATLKKVDDYDLHLMTEEYDLQMGGTGLGAHFFHNLPHYLLNANLDTQACIMMMQTPHNSHHPLGKAVNAATEHTRQLTENGTQVGPPLSHESAVHYLHNFCMNADLPLDCITLDIIYNVAATHTPDISRSVGIPAPMPTETHLHELLCCNTQPPLPHLPMD